MFRRANLIFLSSLFFCLVSAQERVLETRLLRPKPERWSGVGFGSLGSKFFAYSRSDETRKGSKLYRLDEEGQDVLLFRTPLYEYVHDVGVSRDDSRIVFLTSGFSSSYPTIIFSVRPDGSQLTELVSSGDDCRGRFKYIPPGYGPPFCSRPRSPRISPDGRRVLFVHEVREWDEEAKQNLTHYYLSMVPVTGGPIVRLEEVGMAAKAVWSENGASIYYFSSGQDPADPWQYVPRRYDLQTGHSEFLTDSTWKARRLLAVSRSDGGLYFIALRKGLTRLDPETGFAEVVAEEWKWFDFFELSPDGRRAVGLKDGDVSIVNLEFPPSARLHFEPGVVDELELGGIPAARKKLAFQRGVSSWRQLSRGDRRKTGVQRIRWLDNERLWCVVQEEKSTDPTRPSDPEVRVGIVRLTN